MPRKERQSTADNHDLLRNTHAAALRWANTRVDYDTAQDLASEVTISVLERARKQRGFLQRPQELERYVWTACKHALSKMRRDTQRRAEREAVLAEQCECEYGNASDNATEPETAYAQLFAALHDALAMVPASRRVAFMLVHGEGKSYGAVADSFAVSPRAVESRIRRTKIELREKLAGFWPGEPDRAA